VQNNYGCTASDTINIKTLCERSQVFIPKAFSPDGDGINDIFMIRGGGLIVDDFVIYNRWGQIVFEIHNNKPANDPSFGWNGMFNKRIIQDVYSYVAIMHCAAGSEKFTVRGMVTLILAK
jgi:gliding motility-associated-like protein